MPSLGRYGNQHITSRKTIIVFFIDTVNARFYYNYFEISLKKIFLFNVECFFHGIKSVNDMPIFLRFTRFLI